MTTVVEDRRSDNVVVTKQTPDPTILTTEQLLREIANLKNLVTAVVNGRIDTDNERFASVRTEFQLLERMRVEQKKDTKDAVEAALDAAKEAVQEQTKASAQAIAKSEALTATQLEQLSRTFNTGIKSVSNSLDDLKERVLRAETQALTVEANRNTQRLNAGQLFQIISTSFLGLSVLISVILLVNR